MEVRIVMDKDKFTTSLIALHNKSKDFVKQKFEHRSALRIRKPHYKTIDTVGITMEECEVDYFPITLQIVADELKDIAEFTEFKTLLMKHDGIRSSINCMVEVPGGLRRFSDEDLVMAILRILFESTADNQESKIRDIYEKVTRFYETNRITNEGRLVLENVDLGSSHIQIDKDITAMTLRLAEIVQLLNTDHLFERRYGFSSRSPIVPLKSIVQFSFDQPRVTVPYDKTDQFQFVVKEPPEVIARVSKFLDALRILSENAIATSPIYTYHKYSPFDDWPNECDLLDSPRKPPPVIKLADDNLKKVIELYALIAKRTLSMPEQIAMNRLSKFGGRDTFEDKVLDLFVGIEALVLSGVCGMSDIMGELKFRLSLLTAKYIATDDEEQYTLYQVLKKGYDLRSDIVHGKNVDKQKEQLLLDEVTKIYKRLVYKFIQDRSTNQQISLNTLLFK
jgi:hypothetical protein